LVFLKVSGSGPPDQEAGGQTNGSGRKVTVEITTMPRSREGQSSHEGDDDQPDQGISYPKINFGRHLPSKVKYRLDPERTPLLLQ